MQRAYVSLENGSIVDDSSLDELLESGRLTYLGSGISRDTYAIDSECVVKVSNSDANYAGNCQSECAVWEHVEGGPYEYLFAKVYAASASGRWLVMERAEETAGNHPNGWELRRDFLNDHQGTFSHLGVRDLHDGNIGIFAGERVKVIDYAANSGAVSCEESSHDADCECEQCECQCEGCQHDREETRWCSLAECERHHAENGHGLSCLVCNPRGTCQHRSRRVSWGAVFDTCLASFTLARGACRRHREATKLPNPFGYRQGRMIPHAWWSHGNVRRELLVVEGFRWSRQEG